MRCTFLVAIRHNSADPADTRSTAAAALQFEGRLDAEHTAINVDVIHPCMPRHITKYSAQQTVILLETAATYEAVTRPHVEALPAAAIQWVYNILDKSKEAERLIFEDPDPQLGFMLHPDLKWDQSQARLYASAAPRRTGVHLPLALELTLSTFLAGTGTMYTCARHATHRTQYLCVRRSSWLQAQRALIMRTLMVNSCK